MTTNDPALRAAAADDHYCYPGTETLRNNLGITDPAELQRAEYFLTTFNHATLPAVEFSPNGLRAVHRHLFGDLYPWAGVLRDRDMVRLSDNGGALVTFAKATDLPWATDQAFNLMPSARDATVTFAEFAKQMTGMAGALNWLHPFREGNGRTIRAFLSRWSRQRGHNIDFTAWSPKEWLRASTAAYHHDNEPMLDLIVSHANRLDPHDLQRTVADWGQAHLDLDNIDRLLDRADHTRRTATTQPASLRGTMNELEERRNGLIETIHDLEDRLSVDARARGLGAWHTTNTAPNHTRDRPDLDTLEALGVVDQHQATWQAPSITAPTRQAAIDSHAIQDLHRRWTTGVIGRATIHARDHGPDLARS